MADRWMTYEAAGELFGLSAEAIRKRSRRLGWRVQAGNEGKALVLVPGRAELRPAGHPPGRPGGDHPDALLAEVRRRADAAEARAAAEVRASAAETQARGLAGELAGQRERAGRAEGEAAAL